MIETSALLAFCLAALALAVLPGPAVMYIVTRSISQGKLAGMASVAGIALGGLVHVLGAAVGISAVFARSAELFTAIKLAGAAYLIWLGIGRLRTPSKASVPVTPGRRVFWDGFIVQILNPKTALFFLAFLPQFVTLDGWPTALQAALLGAIFVTIALLTDSLYALGAGSIQQRLSKRRSRFTSRVAAALYIGLGVYAALSGRGTAA